LTLQGSIRPDFASTDSDDPSFDSLDARSRKISRIGLASHVANDGWEALQATAGASGVTLDAARLDSARFREH
jgi:hypothetical protein